MINKRRDRRKQRQMEAAERAARNIVVSCPCGRRHATSWPGCVYEMPVVAE